VRLRARIGEALPLHCTAAGKVQLAFIPDADLREALLEGLNRFTEHTVTDRQELVGQLKTIAEKGFSVEVGEHLPEVHSIAVPIRDYTRNVVGSLALSGPAYRMSSDRIEKEMVPLMQKAGHELSKRLGFDG
jgi:DNA-binding IclR family transcriptional regulator